MIFIIWILLAILVGVYASKKGRSGIGFFLFSLLFSPFVGFVVALILLPSAQASLTKALKSKDMKQCTQCAELVLAEAKICKHCKSELPLGDLPIESPSVMSGQPSEDYISKLINGKYSLPITFWIFGVIGMFILAVAEGVVISSGSIDLRTFMSFISSVYFASIALAVWRAGKSFQGISAFKFLAFAFIVMLFIIRLESFGGLLIHIISV